MPSAAAATPPTPRFIRSSRSAWWWPGSVADIEAALAIAREEGVSVLPRGGGTSQCGQTVGESLVIDTSKYLNRVLDVDVAARRATVEPGLVLDRLNSRLAGHGLFFPVDISTGSRATLGGMAGNNSCGARSIRYGNMVHNVHAIDAILPTGERYRFRPGAGLDGLAASPAEYAPGYAGLVQDMRALAAREADEIAARIPKLLRRVGGYNIDSIFAGRPQHGASAGRLRGHLGLLHRTQPRSCSRCPRTRCSASATSRPSTRRWRRPSTSLQAEAVGGRIGRP